MIVANLRELRAISHSDRKSDYADAEKLARFARLDPQILRPIAHRTVEQQEALTLIRARALMVRLRTAAVNAVRGLAKPCGYRLPASSTRCFSKRSLVVMPPELSKALGPVLEQIAEMTIKIKHYDRQILELTQTEYAETQALPIARVHTCVPVTIPTSFELQGPRREMLYATDQTPSATSFHSRRGILRRARPVWWLRVIFQSQRKDRA